METFEELRQSNAKLTERLNNAAKFFREQKAQIEALTKENEELKNQINRTPQEEIISTEDWNKLVTEKENLNDQLKDYKNDFLELKQQLEEKDKKIKDLEDINDTINKQYDELENQNNEKLNELTLEKESLKEQLDTSNAACADMENAIHKDLEDIEKLKKENDQLKSDYTLLNDEYLNNENILGETLAANKELVESNKHLSEQNNELKKNNEELTITINTYKKQLNDTEEALNNAENIITTINTTVNHHIETAAIKPIKESRQHRIGDEHVMAENIGI